MKRNAGRLLRGATSSEPFFAFVPAPLPPEPPLEMTPAIQELLEQANRALGRLDGAGAINHPESFGGPKTGSAGRAPAMLAMCRLLLK